MTNENGATSYSLNLDTKEFERDARKAQGAFERISESAQREADKIDNSFANLGRRVAGAFAVGSIIEFERKIISVRSEMESLQISFETLAGKQLGRQLYNDIKQFAATTPMMMGDLAKGAQTLLGFNIEAEKVMPILREIGDISMGDAQKFNSLTLAFAQMSSTGKLMGQDFNQMVNAGFNPLSVMAEKTGKSISKLKDEMSQGKITVQMVEDAFRSATEEGGKFNGMLEKQSKGLRGALSNLEGSFEDVLNDIGEKQQGVLVDGINLASEALKHYEDFAKVLLSVVAAYGSYKAVLLLAAAAQKAMALWDNIQLMMMFRKELGLATAAQQAFNLSVKANPAGLLISAISGVVAATMLFTSRTSEAEEAQKKLNKAFDDTQASVMSEQRNIDALFNKLRKAEKGTTDYKKAKDAILDQYGKYLDGLDKEIATLGNVEAAYKAVTRAAREAALARGREAALGEANKTYGDTYSASIGKLQDALTKRGVDRNVIKNHLKEIQKELRETGTISATTEAKVRDLLRGSFNYGQAAAWFTTLRNNETNLRDAIERTDELFQMEDEKVEASTQQVKNLGAAYAEAEKAYNTAHQKIEDMKKSRSSYTEQEWQDAQEALKTAKKTFEELGGDPEGKRGKRIASETAKLGKEHQEYLAMQRELARERIRQEYDLWEQTEQAAIDAMREGSAKTLRQIELDFAQRKEELRRQYIEIRRQKFEEDKRLWEADPKHKNTPFTGKIEDAKYNLTSKELEQLRQQEAAAVQAHAKALEDIERQNTQHLNEYLRQYGSYQDQRAAIDREYAQKIADADSAIQKRALEAERDRLKSELDLKALQDNINWEDIFNNIDSHTTVYLKAIKDKLRAALNAKDITAENAKVIAEKIREIENTIADKQDIFGSLLPGLRERKRLTEEALRAEQELNAAIQKQMAASMKVFSDQFAIQKKLAEAEITVSLQDINEEKKEQLLSSLDKGSDLYKGLLQLFQNLAADTSAKNKSDEEVSKKQSRKQEVNDLLKGKGALTDIFSFGSGSPIEIIEGINANAQSMRDLVSDFRLDNTDFGKAVNNFADGCASFNNVVQDLLSGNVFGAVHDVLNGIGSWAQIFYAGGNEKEMEAEIAKLAKANETLAAAIDSLSERIADSDATNGQSVEAYRKSIEAEKQWEENQRKAIDDRASEWTNTGYGFLRMGGKGSFNTHMPGNDWAGWQAFTKVLRDNDINKSVNRENIWTLSPEEMKLLRDFAPKEWQALFNGDGHRNPEELVNEYIERAGMQDMLTSALNKKLTGYDWEGFKSTYSNLLKDLTSDNKKFADNLEDMLSSAILESLVNEQYKDRIKDIYGMIADAASDGTFDEDELRKIREANDKLSADILRDRQALIDAGIIIPGTDSDTTDQSSTKKGFATASQDSIDELNGRFSGLMMIEEEAKNILITSSADIAIIREFESQHISIAEEIRNLAVLMVSHLEDISKYTKHLIRMDDNLETLTDRLR